MRTRVAWFHNPSKAGVTFGSFEAFDIAKPNPLRSGPNNSRPHLNIILPLSLSLQLRVQTACALQQLLVTMVQDVTWRFAPIDSRAHMLREASFDIWRARDGGEGPCMPWRGPCNRTAALPKICDIATGLGFSLGFHTHD